MYSEPLLPYFIISVFNMNTKIKRIITGAIIGDALGSPLDGMSRGHIHSSFKRVDGFIDPTPGLKGKMDRWRMPGLYSSLSQMMIINSYYLISNKQLNEKQFIEFIKRMPDVPDSRYSILRNPGQIERGFIDRINQDTTSYSEGTFNYPNAGSAIFITPCIFNSKSRDIAKNTIRHSLLFNRELYSLAGTLIFTNLIDKLVKNDSSTSAIIKDTALETARNQRNETDDLSGWIFDKGINPDTFSNVIEDYINILSEINKIDDLEDAEKAICAYVNSRIKSPITRATVNHPLAIIPYSIFITAVKISQPSEILFYAANQGGASSVLCSLTGILAGSCIENDWLPEELTERLVNKKRINSIIEEIARGRLSPQIIDEFIKSEASLTQKEIQERNAKLKHVKIKTKKKKTRKDKEKEISKHVVESWTKSDQAKWRKKLDKQKE